MSQAIEATIGAVPGRRGKHKREIPGLSGLDEAPLQRLDDLVGVGTPDEATVSPERMIATASAASTILLRIRLCSRMSRRGRLANRRYFG